MMRVIALAFLVFTFWSAGCIQSAKTNNSQAMSNQEFTVTPTIDAEKAREVSDGLTEAIIEDRYEDIYVKMDKSFRDAIAEKDVKQSLEKLYAQYGKPLEVEYKTTEIGFEILNGQKRPIRKNLYAAKTSKAEKGTYFLFTTIVLDGDSLERVMNF